MIIDERTMSKQPPPAPTVSAIGPCPTIMQISRTPQHWKFTQYHHTTRPPTVLSKWDLHLQERICYVRSKFLIQELTPTKKECKTVELLSLQIDLFTLILLNPLDTSGLFHCYMLDESICYFRGVRSILSLLFYF